MISIKYIEYFVLIAETGQISKTAKDLKLSQSTLTMAIQSLEKDLNTKLLIRRKSGVELTYKGNLFLQHGKRLLSSLEEMMLISKKKNLPVKGEVRLAISFTVSGYFFAGYYALFTRYFPHVKINMVESDRQSIEDGLINGTYDIGLFNLKNIHNTQQLASKVILQSKRRLWVKANHPFSKKSIVSLKEVAKENYILITVDESQKTTFEYWGRTPYKPNVVYTTSSIEAVRSMVSNGNGVTILADMVYRQWSLEGKKVDTVDILEKVPTFDVGLAWCKDKKKSEAAQCFEKFMLDPKTSSLLS